MAPRQNYYQILHVCEDAPAEVIRATYRAMMQKMKMHPDLGGDPQKAALLNEAYSVLINPDTRAKYDASLTVLRANPDHAGDPQGHRSRIKIEQMVKSGLCVFCQLPHRLGDNVRPDSTCRRCGSALYLASKQAHGQDGQRIIQRIEKKWPVSYYAGWPTQRVYIAETQDVSLNGIQLLTNYYVGHDQILKLSSHKLDAVAVVMYIKGAHTLLRQRWRVGLEFITLRFHQTHGNFVKINV